MAPTESSTAHSSLPIHLHYIWMLSGHTIFHGWIANVMQPAYLYVSCWWLSLPLPLLRDYHLAVVHLCHFLPTACAAAAPQIICVIAKICLFCPLASRPFLMCTKIMALHFQIACSACAKVKFHMLLIRQSFPLTSAESRLMGDLLRHG